MKPLRMLTPLILVCVLIWCPPNSINADTDPAQVAALLEMYNFLSSRDQLSNWNTNSGDPCGQAWIGVTCSGSSITELKLSGLGLVGSMGYKFSNLVSLINLDLSNNHLANEIPYPLPPNARNINLAGNNLSGVLPYSISNLTSLEYLNVSHNQLQGQLNEIFTNLSALSTMDLSFNSFTGNLPQSLASLSSMTSMFLENNQFTGTVNVLANVSLKTLDISNNQFTGWIPDQLKSISLLKDGNLWNSGSAPPPPPGTPPYSPNKPNHKSSSNNKPSPQSSRNSDGSKSGVGVGVIVAIVISVLVVGALVAFVIMKKRSRSSLDIEKHNNRPSLPAPSNEVQEIKPFQTSAAISSKTFEVSPSINLRPPPVEQNKSFDDEDFLKQSIVVKKVNTMAIDAKSYSIAELQIATDSFSAENLIGEGSFGRIYRAEFSDGKVVAVKKIDSFALSNHMSGDFMEIVASISQLHHQNISELVGYCSEHEQHLLVYEFHNNGSLHELLHLSDGGSKPLTWNSRVKIALGTARALEYLHEVCSPSIVHKNIKSSKILLDMELNPHLSDSGLASFIPNVEQILNNNAGSGYNAPEVDMSGQYTLKSDVYSFGVAMLELLTGRKPFDSLRPRSEQVLVGWAMPQLHDIDALGKMVDPALEGLYPVKSLSRFADVIALCIQPEPEFRPPMSEVVQALVRLVQRANMSRRTVGTDRKAYQRAHSLDGSYQRADSLDETYHRTNSLDWKDVS